MSSPAHTGANGSDMIAVFLCGDVMLGRGIDQVLPHPSDPRLYESYIASATDYLHLAEASSGWIPRPVDFAYVWGTALAEWRQRAPDVRVVNLVRALKLLPRAAAEARRPCSAGAMSPLGSHSHGGNPVF